jgi:sugar transferase (PEP-CTERM/EpsH1 system associated)
MKTLLYLVHRLPYPPNKGDKIPSFKMLEYLSEYFNIYLGTFVDIQEDWQYVTKIEQYCEDVCVVGISPLASKIKSLKGFLTGEPLSLPYYNNGNMRTWVNHVLSDIKPEAVLMYSGVTAQFVTGRLGGDVNSLLDLVDVDSDKWRQYAQMRSWPMSWVYRRESRKLLAYEKAMAAEFDATMLVSENEANLFKKLAPESAGKIFWRTQGVDAGYFNPEIDFQNPYRPGDKVIVFTGVMDYWTNVDAVCWFAEDMFPEIQALIPKVKFYIVGRNPVKKVIRLQSNKAVVVTGTVEDVRPFLKHAALAVAPLRIARGIQNKILEAFAMAKPVVATSNAFSGIDPHNYSPRLADSSKGFIDSCVEVLSSEVSQDFQARELITKFYGWESSLEKVRKFLE